MSQFKTLHSFVVNLDKEVEKTETKTEDGKEITVKSKVIEKVPYTVILKNPTRRERQSLSLFYTVTYNKAIEQGLMPKIAVVQKFLKDPDSPLSQDDDKNIGELYNKMESLRNDYLRVKTLEDNEENRERQEKTLNEFILAQKKVTDVETAYRSLFAHTAETYAQNQALSWLVLFLTYYKTGNDEPRPMFPGETFDKKEEVLFDLEESEDKLYFESLDRLSLYCSLYFSGQAAKPEDFQKIEDEYQKELELEEKESVEADAS